MALNSLMYPGEFEHFLGTPSRQLVQQTQRRRFWGTQLVGLMSDFTDGQALCVDFGRQPRACFRGRQGPATARRDVSSPPLGTEWEAGSTAGEPGRRFLTSHPLVFSDRGLQRETRGRRKQRRARRSKCGDPARPPASLLCSINDWAGNTGQNSCCCSRASRGPEPGGPGPGTADRSVSTRCQVEMTRLERAYGSGEVRQQNPADPGKGPRAQAALNAPMARSPPTSGALCRTPPQGRVRGCGADTRTRGSELCFLD